MTSLQPCWKKFEVRLLCSRSSLMKRKALVVEDEEPLRSLYREELKREGYEVLAASNAKEPFYEWMLGNLPDHPRYRHACNGRDGVPSYVSTGL